MAMRFPGFVQQEARKATGAGVNGGFFVAGAGEVLPIHQRRPGRLGAGPLRRLAEEGQLSAYRHSDFWAAMDTLRDKNHLEELLGFKSGAVEGLVMNADFWRGKRVLLTGHTGFKGSWLSSMAPAARRPRCSGTHYLPTEPESLFDLAAVGAGMRVDVRGHSHARRAE